MTFRVGQKVVCVKRGGWTDQFDSDCGETYPVFGEIYTIRYIEAAGNHLWLRFIEIVNSPRHYGSGRDECVFSATRFRPVVDKKTDIGVFTEILRKASRTRETVA